MKCIERGDICERAGGVWAQAAGEVFGGNVAGAAIEEKQIGRCIPVVSCGESVGFVLEIQKCAVKKEYSVGSTFDLGNFG